MAVVTYYSLFSSGVTVFNGYVTNTGTQCSNPTAPVYPALAELSTINSLCAGSSPRYQATGTMTNQMSFAVGGFSSATIISNAKWQIWVRRASTKQFWLEAYNSSGVKQSTIGPVSFTGSSVMANITFPGSLTVPTNGFLVVRCGFIGASNRFYFGTNPKNNGLPSAVLTTTQLPAIKKPICTASGLLGIFSGSSSGLIELPVTRSVSVTLYDHTGAILPNQTCKVYADGGPNVSDIYKGTVSSDANGLITFTQTLPPSEFKPIYFTGSYKRGTTEYTYRSEFLTPV